MFLVMRSLFSSAYRRASVLLHKVELQQARVDPQFNSCNCSVLGLPASQKVCNLTSTANIPPPPVRHHFILDPGHPVGPLHPFFYSQMGLSTSITGCWWSLALPFWSQASLHMSPRLYCDIVLQQLLVMPPSALFSSASSSLTLDSISHNPVEVHRVPWIFELQRPFSLLSTQQPWTLPTTYALLISFTTKTFLPNFSIHSF